MRDVAHTSSVATRGWIDSAAHTHRRCALVHEGLQTLEALVRTGSVEAAGRELALQHSTVSRRIAALEVERLPRAEVEWPGVMSPQAAPGVVVVSLRTAGRALVKIPPETSVPRIAGLDSRAGGMRLDLAGARAGPVRDAATRFAARGPRVCAVAAVVALVERWSALRPRVPAGVHGPVRAGCRTVGVLGAVETARVPEHVWRQGVRNARRRDGRRSRRRRRVLAARRDQDDYHDAS